jgi:hypothetical protein
MTAQKSGVVKVMLTKEVKIPNTCAAFIVKLAEL